MSELVHKERLEWKGTVHDLELYKADSADGLNPVKQVQAVPFTDSEHILLYKHIDGYYGLPGGSIEPGESFEKALKREVFEESGAEVIDCGLIGYVKDMQVEPLGETKYQLRYWAKVKLLDSPINDPAGKAIEREIVPIDEVITKLNWGERWKILLQLALEKFK